MGLARIASTIVWIGGIVAVGLATGVSFGAVADDNGYRAEKNRFGLPAEHMHDYFHGGPGADIVWNSSFEEVLSIDQWSVERGYLKTPPCDAKGSFLAFGDWTWSDYEFSAQACTTKGDCELLLSVRCGLRESYRLILGADGNRQHKLLRVASDWMMRKRDMTLIDSANGYIDHGRCHRIRIRCEGKRLQVWLDESLLFDVVDNSGPSKGRVSLGARNGQAQFRNLRITGLDGKALFQGLPTQTGHWLAVGTGKVTLDKEHALNRKRSVKIVSDFGETGIEQDCSFVSEGLWRGTLWVRGEASEGLTVYLRDGDEVLAEKKLPVPSSDWRGLAFDFTLAKAVKNAKLQILAGGKATVWIDQVQIVSDSAGNSEYLTAGQ